MCALLTVPPDTAQHIIRCPNKPKSICHKQRQTFGETMLYIGETVGNGTSSDPIFLTLAVCKAIVQFYSCDYMKQEADR